MRFIKLLDATNYGKIIMEQEGKYYEHKSEAKASDEFPWKPTNIMDLYNWGKDSNLRYQYKIVSETEAYDLIKNTSSELRKELKVAKEIFKETITNQETEHGILYKDYIKKISKKYSDIEYKIVSYLYYVCKEGLLSCDDLRKRGINNRCIYSINLLLNNYKHDYPYFRNIMINPIATMIKKTELNILNEILSQQLLSINEEGKKELLETQLALNNEHILFFT